MAIIAISQSSDREKLEDRMEVILELAAKEAARKFNQGRSDLFQAQADAAAAERDAIGDRLRRGAVREAPALDGTLEAQLTNAAVERDGNQDIINLYTNADADTFLASQ